MADEMSSPLHPTDSMDCKMESDTNYSTRSTDQSVDDGKDTSKVQQVYHVITVEDLRDAFEFQNQQFKAALDAELDKRFPAQENTTTQTPGTLGSRLTPGGSQHAHAAINIDELLQQRADLAHENQRLEEKYKDTRQRIVHLEAQINKNADLAAQINVANEKNAKLTERMAAFRQMLIPASENQIIDSEIVRRFSRIRSGILALVRQTWKTVIRPGVKSQDMTAEQREFLGVELTYDRLRFIVFSIIHKNVFAARSYFLGNARTDIERSLRKVEDFLFENTPEDNQSSIIAWRSATFKATEGFRDFEGDLSQRARRHVWLFLNHVETYNQERRERAMRKLQTICDEAVELSMMIRQAKDYIVVANCEHAVGEPLSDYDGVMDEVTFAKADDSHKRGTIAYVICGALVKQSKEDPGQVIVLEKAEVAVYR